MSIPQAPAILAHISGLNKNVAQQIVEYRRAHGAFTNREALKMYHAWASKLWSKRQGFAYQRG